MQRFLVILVLIVATTTVYAQTSFTPPKYPWHLINVWWTSIESTKSLEEVSIDFRVVGQIPDTVNLYIAPLGLFKIGTASFYGGVQTNTRGWPSKQDRRLVSMGRSGIFSRWSVDNTPITMNYAEGPEGTHFESSDYEKNFISVRRRTEWKEGSYTYSVRRIRTNASEYPHAWFGAFVRNHASGVETHIGSLRLDGTSFTFDRAISAFVEVYGRKSEIPKVGVQFSEPKVNGSTRPSTSVKVIYPDNGVLLPPRFANAVLLDGSVYVSTLPAGTADGVKVEVLR